MPAFRAIRFREQAREHASASLHGAPLGRVNRTPSRKLSDRNHPPIPRPVGHRLPIPRVWAGGIALPIRTGPKQLRVFCHHTHQDPNDRHPQAKLPHPPGRQQTSVTIEKNRPIGVGHSHGRIPRPRVHPQIEEVPTPRFDPRTPHPLGEVTDRLPDLLP